ncbi:MAG: hypothetical protein U9Q40_05660 [Campylobacterota bacterium]|nr:hypothetical protein [Campylobacterota bacterium]
MGVLRTNEDPSFETEANSNNRVTDQHFHFSIPERGATSYIQILPKNEAVSQVLEDTEVFTLAHDSIEDGIVQVFKATEFDNVNGFKTLAKGQHPGTSIVNSTFAFEEYTTDEELRVDWNTTTWWDDDEIELYLDSDEALNGEYCCRIRAHSNCEGLALYREFASPLDWSGIENVQFNWMSEKTEWCSRWRLKFHDSTGQISSIDFNNTSRNTWELKSFNKQLFSNLGVTDWSQIVKIEFENVNSQSTHNCYLDSIEITTNTEADRILLDTQLIHFGTSPDFATLGSIKTLDDNHDSAELMIDIEVNRMSEANIQYGATRNDWKLIAGDYYGIYIKKPTIGSVKFYGSNTQTFVDGNLYSNSSGALTALNKSLGFMINTFTSSTIKKLKVRQDVHSPNSTFNLMIINPDDFTVNQYLGTYTFEVCDIIEIEFDYSVPESITINNANHLYGYYQDSFESEASQLHICPRYHYLKGEE